MAKFCPPKIGDWSPWGKIDGVTELVSGVFAVSGLTGTGAPTTGIRLSPYRRAGVHPVWRRWGGWYGGEMGCAIVCLTFKELNHCGAAFGRAYNVVMTNDPIAALLALGELLDQRYNSDHDLCPGDAVEWTAKVNEDHMGSDSLFRIYSYFDDSGHEKFVDNDNRADHSWPAAGVFGIVTGRSKWVPRHKELCYPVLHPNGLSWVSRSYLSRVIEQCPKA